MGLIVQELKISKPLTKIKDSQIDCSTQKQIHVGLVLTHLILITKVYQNHSWISKVMEDGILEVHYQNMSVKVVRHGMPQIITVIKELNIITIITD